MRKQQGGYILLLVMVLISVMLLASLRFLDMSGGQARSSAYQRDAGQSLQLAEAGMNLLYGDFVFGRDLDGDGLPDRDESVDMEAPALPYLFFVSEDGQVLPEQPQVLQMIADGEARNESRARLSNQRIHKPAQRVDERLRLTDLFGDNNAPLLYRPDDKGRLQTVAGNWDNTDGPRKVAVWLELVANPTQAGRPRLFAEAVAQVGEAKSYVQRFIGYSNQVLGRQLGALNEANPSPGQPGRERDEHDEKEHDDEDHDKHEREEDEDEKKSS